MYKNFSRYNFIAVLENRVSLSVALTTENVYLLVSDSELKMSVDWNIVISIQFTGNAFEISYILAA